MSVFYQLAPKCSIADPRIFILAQKSVICELAAMTKPRVTDLAKLAGISKTYASDILAGKQPPSRPLAIHILKSTGWRHVRIAGLSDADIDALERLDPWQPQARAA